MDSLADIEEYNQSVIRGLEAMNAAHDAYRSDLSNKEIKEMVMPNLVYTQGWRKCILQARRVTSLYLLIMTLLPLLLLCVLNTNYIAIVLLLSLVSFLVGYMVMREKNAYHADNLTGAYSPMAITDDEIREIMRKE